MALSGGAFAMTIILGVLTLVFSIMVLAYVGGINQKGSAEMKAYKEQLRKWLIAFSSVLLAVAVVAIIVTSVWYAKDRQIVLRGGIAL